MAHLLHSRVLFSKQSKPGKASAWPGCAELIDENHSLSTLSAPAPPPGFEVDIHYDTSNILNPLGVYLCAIDFMYDFARKGWNKRLSGGFTVWQEDYNAEIDIESLHQSSVQLQTCHIVLGLYETIKEVSAQSRFCEVLTTLSMHRRQIGSLAIQKKTRQTTNTVRANATNSLMAKGVSSSNDPTYPSGLITDVDDPPFTVTYTFNGIRTNSRDVFLAVLDALATAARLPSDTLFQSLNAISPSRACVISVAVDSSQSRLSYSYITKALRAVVTNVMVVLRKFEEVTFQLNWRGDKMVEGSIRLTDHLTIA